MYYEAIMDDLLLFTPDMTSHKHKLEDLLKALLKNILEVSPKSANCFRKSCNNCAIPVYEWKEGICKTHENEDRGNAKFEISYYPPGMQKFCWRC